jgi:O-antigen/teichoic acid export membrane protein
MTNPAPSHKEMPSLKKLAIRATIWTITGHGASQLLRLGANLILTRLLFPELFGLVSLVNVFIAGLNLFSDIGIGPSIIQNKHGDEPAFYNTAWTLQAVRGCLIWLGCILIAWPISTFYGEPRLLWLLPLVGIDAFISGFNSTALHTLNRDLEVRQLTLYDLSGQFLCLAIMIVWAWLNPSIWALIVGNTASALIQMFRSHRLSPKISNRFTWDKEALASLSSFGRWIFISTAITFLAEQSDRLILGKLISFEMLGVYGVALTFSDIPRQIALLISGRVLFPVFSKLAGLPRAELRTKIIRNRKFILLIMASGLAIMVCFGDLLISTLYDRRYQEAAWMLPILTLGIWPRVLCNTNEPALFAIGKPQYPAIAQLFRFIFTSIGLIVGYHFYGLLGAVIAVSLNDLCHYAVINYGLYQEGLSGLLQDAQATLILFFVMLSVLAIRSALGFGFPIDALLH